MEKCQLFQSHVLWASLLLWEPEFLPMTLETLFDKEAAVWEARHTHPIHPLTCGAQEGGERTGSDGQCFVELIPWSSTSSLI